MRKILFTAVAAACALLLAGAAVAQTIDEIQVYDATGAPASPYNGAQVTIYGKIYVVKGTYNGGTHYIQGDTGGIQFYFPTAPALTYGDSVEVSGTVSTNSGEIQIGSTGIVVTPLGPGTVPVEPIPVTISDLMNPQDYEMVGNFISVIGTVGQKVGGAPGSSGSFNLWSGGAPGVGDSVFVYIDADTGIDLGAVADGDEYQVSSPCVNYDTLIELKPRKQSDLVEDPTGDPVPVIENVNLADWCPTSSEPITVTATITDVGAKVVTDARLYYRNDNGDSTGSFASVAMTNVGGDTYQAIIPQPHPQRQVDFYVQATDGAAQTVSNPGNAPDAWYEVAIGFLPIYEVQFAYPDSLYQGSPYRDKVVNLHGVVTAGTGDVGVPSKFIIQEPEPAEDGSIPLADGYKWGGILVYEGSGTYEPVLRGDWVEVGGYINEYYGLTEMEPHRGSAVIVTYGSALTPPPPLPTYAPTRTLADNTFDDGNGNMGEAYESVWTRTPAAVVVDDFAGFDNFIISTTGLRADSLEVDPFITLSYVPAIDDVVIVEGFMDFYFVRQLVPTDNNYVVYGLTGVENQTPELTDKGGFVSISPNPFNPLTKIRFRINREGLTQLNLYDIRGQLVRTLVNEVLPAQEHVYEWDGTDMHGARVASGTYFARLRTRGLMQVQKLSLIK